MSTVYLCVGFNPVGEPVFRIRKQISDYGTDYHIFSVRSQAINYARKRGLCVLAVSVGNGGFETSVEWQLIEPEISAET